MASSVSPVVMISDILIDNLHCDSCVRTIEKILSSLSPPPLSFQVSTVSRLLTVRHLNVLSTKFILAALEESGFDILKTSPGTTVDSDHLFAEHLSGSSSHCVEKRRKHIQQCSLCMKNRSCGATNDGGYDANSMQDKSVTYASGVKTDSEQSSYVAEHPLTFDRASSPDGPARVTLSVGGMTCSSCSHTITNTLSELSGVSEVVVGLLDKSVTAVAKNRKLVDDIVRAVEDCGFEAQIVDVEPVKSEIDNQSAEVSRVVSLRVDGMFCSRCPERAMAALNSLGSRITVLKSITTHTDPILKLSYQPSPPSLTIRRIISTISSAKTPPFKVSVHQPTPFEEYARNMHNREQCRLLCRLIFSVLVTIPTFIIAVVYMSLVEDGNPTKTFLMDPMWTGNTSRAVWALFFLATPVMFYSANLFHQRSIKEIRVLWRRGSTTPILKRFVRFGSMNLLVSTGVSVAYFSSIALLGLSAVQPASQERVGDKTTYFDSVVFLTMFLLAGRFLEAYSKGHTASAITALGMLRPAEAFLLIPRSYLAPHSSSSDDLEKGDPTSENMSLSTQPGTTIEKVNVNLLEVGDIVRVQHGSTPPCDGRIVSVDNSAFDESSLTGESRLVKKQTGDMVYLGTINKSERMVDIKVGAIGGGNMLDQIIKVVRQGQTHRAPIERVADILTGYFVPVVTLLAILTWVVWFSLGVSGVILPNSLENGVGGWPVWSLKFAIAVFVVACPCGIGLAAPTAFLVGSGLAAKFGILARGGGEAFQEMAQLDIVVFDKTGTLTEGGEPRVSNFEMLSSEDGFGPEVVLGIAAETESTSSHPLAIAIRHFCEGHGASIVTGSDFMEAAGRGLKAYFGTLRCTAVIGNEAWIQEHGVVTDPDIARKLEDWKSEGKSIILLALRHESRTAATFNLVTIFAITDPLRPEAKDVVRCLQEQGIGTWMLSGDNVITAETVAKTVGIPGANVIAGVLPHQKAEKIQWLQQMGSKRRPKWQSLFWKRRLNMRCIVAMVGDGINDAPALTAADIGIAIGSGSDVAISSASFILVSSNLRGLITLSDLSRKVFSRVKFNFLWAVLYNLAALPVAAGVLYPAGHARLDPVWASLAMALSSVSVVCSSLLLKLYKEPKMDWSTA